MDPLRAGSQIVDDFQHRCATSGTELRRKLARASGVVMLSFGFACREVDARGAAVRLSRAHIQGAGRGCAPRSEPVSSPEDPMETKDFNAGKFLNRHLSQIKILSRLLEHELDVAKGGREVTIDRHLVENVLDTMEIFVEDTESASGIQRERTKQTENKPAVARLN
jgi:hypothetical protein